MIFDISGNGKIENLWLQGEISGVPESPYPTVDPLAPLLEKERRKATRDDTIWNMVVSKPLLEKDRRKATTDDGDTIWNMVVSSFLEKCTSYRSLYLGTLSLVSIVMRAIIGFLNHFWSWMLIEKCTFLYGFC